MGDGGAASGPPFTAFAAVTPQTPLAQLNLNWREADLPERERTKHVHRLHPYLGKFVPQLVEIFLRKYSPRLVCDPFCGSGTTLVEATALGIDAVGCDLSPFNCLLSKVKTGAYDPAQLERDVEAILAEVIERLESQAAGNALPEDGATDYLKRWYAPPALRQLLLYRSLIPRYQHQDVLKVILSRAARSARLTTHFDLDFPLRPATAPYYCHKHRRICQPTADALSFLRRYSRDTVRRIRSFAQLRCGARRATVEVIQGDARELAFPACDLVVTSPPYAGLIDYHEQHRYAYELLGLEGAREREIGASWKGASRRALDAYVDDITAAFANVAAALRPGGRMVVVVNDRCDLYEGIARRLGVTVEHRLRRHVNRRTGRRPGDFFEDVLVWRTG
ncbi:MAG TPA: DNA methyltransferase [Chloroflexota bacterium]|nr:DNA methyltransferase [Chloroflexota bacterium]